MIKGHIEQHLEKLQCPPKSLKTCEVQITTLSMLHFQHKVKKTSRTSNPKVIVEYNQETKTDLFTTKHSESGD